VSLEGLHRLKVAWEAAYPRQATGGERAIVGFHYQFLQTLFETAKAYLTLPPARRGTPTVSSEWLSDLTNASDSEVFVITQVKYTQSSGMVISALADLWRIHDVASTSTPDLLPRLRFRVLSARSFLKNVSKTIENWSPDGIADDDPSLSAFRSRIQIELHSDPENDLLALLANEFCAENPLAIMQAWLGRLLEAAAESNGYKQVGRQIWNDMHQLERVKVTSRAKGIHVWTTRDRAPDSVREGKVLTGEQPLVFHLREGYFSRRNDLLDPLADRVTTWVASNPTAEDTSCRLQIFWIGGRSGAGKSVALLHVLALLHERGLSPILWLGNKVANLPAAIRWARELRRPGQPVVVGIDDPYSPAAQSDASAIWREAFAELQESREAGDASSLPVIICCGPTEQADRLRSEWPDDVVVTLFTMRNESDADIMALREWYRARTGEEAPDVGDENVLLVQLFFQWRVGVSIIEFARRFRRRINAADRTGMLEKALSRMLALNRLYVGYCRAAFEHTLDAEQRDVATRLLREEHLAENLDNARSGVWLAHPHLANAIYEAWHPVDSSDHVRREHLRLGILGALEWGGSPAERTAPLWALSRLFDDNPSAIELARRLGAANARFLLEEIYRHSSEVGGRMPLAQLPAWIQVRLRVAGIQLSPDPLTEAIERVGHADLFETGLRLTCHKLIEHLDAMTGDERCRVVDAVIGLLGRSLDWYEWPHLALHVVLRTGDERLWPLVANWFPNRSRMRVAQRLLLVALQSARTSPHLSRVARMGLVTAAVTEDWSRIAAHLLKTSEPDSPPTEVLAWASSKRLDPEAAILIGKCLQHRFPGSERWALEWAARWYRERNASFVLEPLCEVLLSSSTSSTAVGVEHHWHELIEWSCAWIEEGHGNTAYLLSKLLKLSPHDPHTEVLARLGRVWLAEAPTDHGSWALVWQPLWQRAIKTSDGSLQAELVVRGMRWLATELSSQSFAFVCIPLWRYGVTRDELRGLVERFLATASRSHLRYDEVEALVIGDPLQRLPFDDPKWVEAWVTRSMKDVRFEGSVSQEVAEVGLRWLQTSYDYHYWASVFLRLWEAGVSPNQLAHLGREWLDLHPFGRRAKRVYQLFGLEASVATAESIRRPESERAPPMANIRPRRVQNCSSVAVGSVIDGVVTNVVDYGIFVGFGTCNGLLHVSTLPLAYAAEPSAYFWPGQVIRVVVVSVDAEHGHIELRPETTPAAVWTESALATLRVGGEHEGVVLKALKQGFYIKLGNVSGFLPRARFVASKMTFTMKPLKAGQTVRVQIVGVELDRQWIELGLPDRKTCPSDCEN